MTDKKLTYKEIIKALECCANCEDCFYDTTSCPLGEQVECRSLLAQNALDLITHQQAELENLKVENQSLRTAANSLKMHYEEAQAEIERLNEYNENLETANTALSNEILDIKSEAVKEFVEKLKEFMHNKFKALDEYEFEYITERDIDNLLKETEGENNA